MAKNQIEKATAKEVATLAEGMDLDELVNDSGMGPQMGLDDLGLPYIYLLQPMSPQANRADPRAISGAEPGMFYNHITLEVFEGAEQGLMVVPCYYERKFVEWMDRDKGGGWIADHHIDSGINQHCTPDDKKRLRLNSNPDHLIVETAYQYVLLANVPTGQWEQVCIPLKSTGLKANRRINKLISDSVIPGTTKPAPRFLFPYQIRSVGEQKDNNFFFNFDVERLPTTVNREVYQAAKRYHDAIASGAVKRADEIADGPVDVVVTRDEPVGDRSEIPF